VYIVRENHVFDDYLGDCALNINASCDDNQGWQSPTNGITSASPETTPNGNQLVTPHLHDLARNYTVFDNMYSSIDPYSSQAHAYLYTANTWGGSDSVCASGGTEGTGSSTEWGIYNGTATSDGLCSFGSDGNDQTYNTGNGSIFDRYLGPNVPQTSSTIPFLTIGDMVWELASPSCTAPVTTGIPGSLPGDSIDLEHITGCQNGWWFNTTNNKPGMPPAVNTVTGIPQELWVCMETSSCSSSYPSPFLDQYAAYSFISYLADYGLPTYTYISLLDDHPGSLCGSSQAYSTCIEENDASMNLIVQAIENSTTLRNNTVIAISEDDTQAGQNGRDHINDGRRFPFVLVAPHNAEKQGRPIGTDCGIAASLHCGYVVHQTFNTSNVLAVMERVEMNVNPNSFALGPPTGTSTFPMVENDYLAEGNPLEPVWKCGNPGVPCNTGVAVQTLTSTSISPNPVSAAVSTAVPVTATALDQNGAKINAAVFNWTLTPPSLGSLSASTGSPITFNAAATAGTGHLCENATYKKVTMGTCALVSVSATISLASVAIAPSGTVPLAPNAYEDFQASSLGSNGQPLTASTIFNWTMNPTTLGSLNKSTNTRWTNLTAGAATGNITLCLNGTYKGVTQMTCDIVYISLAPAVLTSVLLIPSSLTINVGGTQEFYAQPLNQYGKPYTAPLSYQWTLSNATLGSVNPTNGTGNTTLFTAGTTAINGTLKVFTHTGSISAYKTINIEVVKVPPITITSVTVSPAAPSVPSGTNQVFTASPKCSSTCPTTGITYSWTLTSTKLGTISPTSGISTTFTAGTTAVTGGIFVNATLNGTAVKSSAEVTVTVAPTNSLTSVSMTPATASLAPAGTESFTATPTCSTTCPTPDIVYAWSLTKGAMGAIAGSGASVTFTAGSTAGTVGIFVNATLNGTTKGSSAEITITASPTISLAQVTLSPMSINLSSGVSQPFTAIPACTSSEGGSATCPSGISYVWTMNGNDGTLSSTSGPSTTFTAGSSGGAVSLTVTATLNGVSKGASAAITIASSQGTTSGGMGSMLLWLIVILVAAVVVIVVAVLLIRRKGKQPASMPAQPLPAQPYMESSQFPTDPSQVPPGDVQPAGQYYQGPQP
jgi:hypothetical protein